MLRGGGLNSSCYAPLNHFQVRWKLTLAVALYCGTLSNFDVQVNGFGFVMSNPDTSSFGRYTHSIKSLSQQAVVSTAHCKQALSKEVSKPNNAKQSNKQHRIQCWRGEGSF
eukprot:1207684-Amphidinium_carterae.1